MSYCVFIQRAVGSLQKCSLLYSTWHLELVIGRNQDWFHESNKGTQSEKHQLFRALQNYSTSKARKVPLQTLNKRCRGNSAWCRTRGTEGRPMKSRAMQTSITASALWCLEDCLAKTTAAGSSRPPQYRWDSTAEWEEEDLGETGWTLWISDDTMPACLKWSSVSTLISCPPWEVQKAIKQLSAGKVPGPDAIPAKVFKAGVATMMQKVKEVFQSMWNEGKVPQQLKDTSIAHIYSWKRQLPVFWWQNLGPHSAEPRHSTSWEETPPRKSVWFPLRRWNCRHDIRCTPAPGKMLKSE